MTLSSAGVRSLEKIFILKNQKLSPQKDLIGLKKSLDSFVEFEAKIVYENNTGHPMLGYYYYKGICPHCLEDSKLSEMLLPIGLGYKKFNKVRCENCKIELSLKYKSEDIYILSKI